MFAEVLVEIKAKGINQSFTYHIPLKYKDDVVKGKRVLVPFGNQKVEGFVLDIIDDKKEDYVIKLCYLKL